MVMMVETMGEVLGIKVPDMHSGQLVDCGTQWGWGKESRLPVRKRYRPNWHLCLTYTCMSFKILVSRITGIGIWGFCSLFWNAKGWTVEKGANLARTPCSLLSVNTHSVSLRFSLKKFFCPQSLFLDQLFPVYISVSSLLLWASRLQTPTITDYWGSALQKRAQQLRIQSFLSGRCMG